MPGAALGREIPHCADGENALPDQQAFPFARVLAVQCDPVDIQDPCPTYS